MRRPTFGLLAVIFSFALTFVTIEAKATEFYLSPPNSIQAAVDAASNGDIINLASGTYTGNIIISGKTLTLRGADPETTIIQGTGSGTVVSTLNGSNAIEGVTITGGNTYGGTGGIYDENGLASLTNCILTNNYGAPAAMYSLYSNIIIADCKFVNNYVTPWSGILCFYGNPSTIVRNCLFSGNNGDVISTNWGYNVTIDNCIMCYNNGAVISTFGSHVEINNCLAYEMTGSTALYLAGPYSVLTLRSCTVANNYYYTAYNSDYGHQVSIYNSIFWSPNHIYGMEFPWSMAWINIYNSVVRGGYTGPGAGIIDSDPLFVDAANGDYRLQANSPCVDSGDTAQATSTDLGGNARPFDGDGNGVATVDMGVFEFIDTDHDGYGIPFDCDDANAAVHPGATDIWRNSVDEDCNGYDLTIDILAANYNSKNMKLNVTAESLLYAAAQLTAHINDGGISREAAMTYDPVLLTWSANFTGLSGNPGQVDVYGPEGSVTEPTR